MKRLSPLSWLVACGLVAAACADPKPAVTPDKTDDVKVEKTAPKEAKKTDQDDDSLDAKADVDDRITKMCDLPEARFDFNSSSVTPGARRLIDAIAKCFTDGAGKGKSMAIVGHADNRGEEEYNFGLGQRRAGAVGNYLKQAGLGEDRYSTSSRGELDATGSDDAGWARDRRVEILLAQ